jgi:hypothetical protein
MMRFQGITHKRILIRKRVTNAPQRSATPEGPIDSSLRILAIT